MVEFPAFICGRGRKGWLQVNIILRTALLRHTKYSILFWYFNDRSKEKYRGNITRKDAAQQNVRYHNTATLNNVTVRTGIILEDPGEGQREK